MITRYGIKKVLRVGIFLVIIAIIVGYSYFAFKDYLSGPEIIVTDPINGSTISTSTVIVNGKALRIKDITFNSRPILIDKDGNFSEIFPLLPGYNVSLISATDRFNRTIEYKLELVYQD